MTNAAPRRSEEEARAHRQAQERRLQRRRSPKSHPVIDRNVEQVIGQRVKQLRMQLSMSQKDLGNEVGLTFQQIQKYEKGANRISVSRMLQFASILQTSPHDIIGWKGNGKTLPNGFNTPLFEAAREFAQLPEDVQVAVRRICGALIDAMKRKR